MSESFAMSDDKQPETIDRLAKVIARAGLCSRRDAEGWITAGRVAVNGKKVITPAFNVTDKDKIEVDGLPLAARQGTRVWLYHKPAGLVVTEKDPEGRRTIFEELEAKGLPRVLTVGRLDINTEGLLLLTNDGGLKRVLELPSTGWLRRYRVRAHGSVTQAQLDALKDGITVEGIQYGPITATLEREQGANVWLVLGLREGKNREVKNVLGSLGLEVNRLIRVSYGPFQLGDLPENGVEMVKARMLRDQLGKKLAESAGVDFDSEMPDPFAQQPREEGFRVRSPRDRDNSRPNPARGATRRPGAGQDDDRPMGRPRRIHFEDDGRAPEAYEPKGGDRPRFDRDDRPTRSFGKDAGERPKRDFGDKPARSGFGDRPKRDFGDKPKRDFGDKPQRAYGDRPSRGPRPEGFSDRPKRDFGDRTSRGPRPEGGFNDRPKRDYGDRPQRPYGDRPSRGPRPEGGFNDRPKRDYGDRPDRGPRPEGGFNDRPKRDYGDRPQRPQGDRPSRGPRPEGFADRPKRDFGDRPQRPYGDKPRSGPRPTDKPFGDRPARGGRPGGKPFAGKPGNKPFGGKPGGARPSGGRPTGGRPTGGPRKPRG
jgi:23S rRNA pseudouridine2605 synthase